MAGCPCPQSSSIPTIPDNDCAVIFDRINKFGICRQQIWTSLTGDQSSTISELQDLTEWATPLAAVDETKVTITPIVGEFIIEAQEPIFQTFDGDEKSTGSYAPQNVTFQLQGASSEQLQALRLLACETNLYTMMFDKDRNIIHGLDGAVPIMFPVAIQTWTTTDMSVVEAGALVVSFGKFQFQSGWSTETSLTVTTPDFNPLTDLAN